MKKALIATVLILAGVAAKSQTIRYFEFRQPFDSTTTSFIVATSDSTIISAVLNEIALPIDNRKFISGDITDGNGGFNHDGTNPYSWHFIPNEWQLTASNVEYCDGISSAIGSHPSIIAGDTLYFCPWTSYPVQEVNGPTTSIDAVNSEFQVTIYPNPSSNKVFFDWESSSDLVIDFYNVAGQHILSTSLTKHENEVDVSNLTEGLFFVKMAHSNSIAVKKIVIKH